MGEHVGMLGRGLLVDLPSAVVFLTWLTINLVAARAHIYLALGLLDK